MNYTCTFNDLMLYYYNETSMVESALIQTAIDNDWNTKEDFDSIKQIHDVFEDISVEPSVAIVESILNYSLATKPLL